MCLSGRHELGSRTPGLRFICCPCACLGGLDHACSHGAAEASGREQRSERGIARVYDESSRQTYFSRVGAEQMALAVILIAGAGVLGRSLWDILSADVGVRAPQRVLMGQVVLPRERYPSAESRLALFEDSKPGSGHLQASRLPPWAMRAPLTTTNREQLRSMDAQAAAMLLRYSRPD